MAKRFSFLMTILLVSIISFAQTKKASWNEYNAFNVVVAESFHNWQDGNFVPVKTQSGDLLQKAQAWDKSDYPVGYDKAVISPMLTKLVDQSKNLDKQVKAGATNEEVGKLLNELHKQFLKIYDLCTDAKHAQN